MRKNSKHSEEAKEKMRKYATLHPKLQTGTYNFMFGKHHSEETKRKMSLVRKGRKKSEEHKKKIGEAHKGKKHTEESIKKMRESHLGKLSGAKGKHHSDEAKEKNRMAHLGKPTWNKGKKGIYSEETLRKMSKSKEGRTSPRKGKHLKEETKIKLREHRMKQTFPKKETIPERLVFAELIKRNIPFKKHKTITYNQQTKKFTQPDAFIEPNICIFVDGDYWHSNEKYFKKLNPTQTRQKEKDNKIRTELKKMNYVVLSFWESEIKKDVSKCVDRIEESITK